MIAWYKNILITKLNSAAKIKTHTVFICDANIMKTANVTTP